MSSSLLREEDNQELRSIFDAFDHNSDGLLDVDEVAAILHSFGKPMTEAEVLDMVTELKPELKKLPFEDFVNVMCRPMVSEAALREEVKEVFGHFAGAGNTAITAASLQEVMSSLDHPVSKLLSEEMIREADLDRDGKIGLEDFMRTVVL
uniref:EF-hand domain-containing protein n=1 Tax=Phaeocystis antarctica TaxID=33657 RepID=A0A7S0E7T2_9EUKA